MNADISPEQTKYLSDEMDYLRSAYMEAVRETRVLERYALVATGVIWSWLAVNDAQGVMGYIVWFPAIITWLLGLRSWGIFKLLLSLRRYFALVEQSAELPGKLGWEKHKVDDRERFEVKTVWLFWFVLQTLTLVIPIVIRNNV